MQSTAEDTVRVSRFQQLQTKGEQGRKKGKPSSLSLSLSLSLIIMLIDFAFFLFSTGAAKQEGRTLKKDPVKDPPFLGGVLKHHQRNVQRAINSLISGDLSISREGKSP